MISERLGLVRSFAAAAVVLAVGLAVAILRLLPADSELHVPVYVVTLTG